MPYIKYYRTDLLQVIHTKHEYIEYPVHNHISNYTVLLALIDAADSHLPEQIQMLVSHTIDYDLRGRLDMALEYITSIHPFKARHIGPLADSIKVLEYHPETNVTISALAKRSNLSDYYFIKLFKKEVGLTPHQFQIQNRVRKAQHLVEQGCSLTDVAYLTGFCDQSHFIRNFKLYLKMTPRQYQKASQCT